MASFGDTLRRERELRGVDLREVAEATKISVRFLQALESDRIDVLPGGIFPRAFVRQYAIYLGLDPDRTVAEFVYAYGEQAGSAAAAAPRRAAPRSRRLPLLAAAIVLALLGIAAWAAFRHEAQGAAATPPPTAAAPVSTFAPDPVYPPPTTPAALVPAGADQGLVLTLTSRQSCWVAVLADGVKVMDRVMNQGEAQTITAKGEMVLSVGNAGGITFTLNGHPGIALGREGEVRRNIVITRQSLPSLVQQGAPPPSPHAG
jgi:cytoskeleton protein RodZ